MGSLTALPIDEPERITTRNQMVHEKPVPIENSAHADAPMSASRTRGARSAKWAIGT